MIIKEIIWVCDYVILCNDRRIELQLKDYASKLSTAVVKVSGNLFVY